MTDTVSFVRRLGLRSIAVKLAAPLTAACIVGACSGNPQPRRPDPAPPVVFEAGIASWYGEAFEGRPTASGELFDPDELTAAHPCLPFGSRVRVINTTNGREVIVRINDRGPHVRGRIIDVSRAAADALGMRRGGTARVHLVLVNEQPPDCP